MRIRNPLLLTAVAVLAVACSPTDDAATSDSSAGVAAATTADAGAVRASIDSLNAKMADAMKRADSTTIRSLYGDDAVAMMSNTEAWRGRDAIVKGWTGAIPQMGLKDAKFTTDDVDVAGDLVVETGRYEMTFQPKGATKEMKDKGKYVVVWKRQPDGSLKIYRDIGNSDLPPTQ
jgi:ketosteroid isomerase-like protein